MMLHLINTAPVFSKYACTSRMASVHSSCVQVVSTHCGHASHDLLSGVSTACECPLGSTPPAAFASLGQVDRAILSHAY
jgi:hypothetical protein